MVLNNGIQGEERRGGNIILEYVTFSRTALSNHIIIMFLSSGELLKGKKRFQPSECPGL